MSAQSIISQLRHAAAQVCSVAMGEARAMVRDEGLLIFMLLVPLLYPLAYSWIYNNEVVREVPVCVVDDSRTHLSRRFVRSCDATPDVAIVAHAATMDEARRLVAQQRVAGIYYVPSDFATRIGRGEQAAVSVYCDMAMMLNYKAVYQSAVAVAQQMGAEITVARAGAATERESEVAVRPLAFSDVAMFNPAGGYGSFILPAVLMLILQQTLALGMGLSAGTAREANSSALPLAKGAQAHPVAAIVGGKALSHSLLYALVALYLAVLVPRMFHFVTTASAASLLAVLLPYMLACVFFAMAASLLVHHREDVMLFVVFASVPLLFLSGVSWPRSNMPLFWEVVSWLFPSTFGIRAFVGVNTMGASVADVWPQCRALWIQAAAYCAVASAAYWWYTKKARAER